MLYIFFLLLQLTFEFPRNYVTLYSIKNSVTMYNSMKSCYTSGNTRGGGTKTSPKNIFTLYFTLLCHIIMSHKYQNYE